MEVKKRFSIVIPTYQSKKQLGNTLEVLNRQKGIPQGAFEVVVADDGSTDGTKEYIKGIIKNYELKYIYLERNPGSSRSKARNAGIRATEGEIIVFLDADMLVKEDYLFHLDNYFKYNMDILVIGHRIMLTEEVTRDDLSKNNMFEAEKFKMKSFENFEIRHSLFMGTSFNSRCNIYPWIHVYSCNMAVRKELLDRSGYFDEEFRGWGMEDVELGYRLYKAGAKIITGIKIQAFHQLHSTTGNNKNPEDMEKEIDANTMHFIDMHPEAMNLPVSDVLKFFRGTGIINIEAVRDFKIYVKINIRNKSELESAKSKILKYSKKRKTRCIVFDYLEDTDLDIWIQLNEGLKTAPKYFPMIRGQIMKAIAHAEFPPSIFKIKKWSEKLNHETRKKLFKMQAC